MIAVDWGTSSLRVYRLAGDGQVLDQRRSSEGALVSQGRFASVLEGLLDGWDDSLVVMCGMVGGRGGWIEVPYVACPADAEALAAGMIQLSPEQVGSSTLAARRIWCCAGVSDRRQAQADVMRGEETQVAALLDLLGSGVHRVCLPGTHSKWVTLVDGRIERISTSMTGEVYGLLRQHSILGRTMAEGEPVFDVDAFDAGLNEASEAGGLLHDLFAVRTAALFARFSTEALPSYLSGLLIGHELHPALALDPEASVHLLGSDALLERYSHALARLGASSRNHREDLAAHGLFRLAQARGLA